MPTDTELLSVIPQRQIRAVYDDRTIRVYQAYSDKIADTALVARYLHFAVIQDGANDVD